MPTVYAIGDLSTPESGKLPPVGVVADQQGAVRRDISLQR